MTKDDALQVFRDTGALLEGHFILRSGLHSRQFFQCALALQQMPVVEKLGAAVAERVRHLGAVTVISPALGGLVIGQEVARQLRARFIFAEKNDTGKLVLRRGFKIAPGEKMLVVEDVVTKGGRVQETLDIVRAHGGSALGVAMIVDRSDDAVNLGVPLFSLISLKVETFEADKLPTDLAKTPAVKPGANSRMAYDTFRDFVLELDKAGELKRISQPIATELEITELADREMKSPGGGKALLIEKPTIAGHPSSLPLAINALGSERRMAMSLGVDSVEAVAAELGSLMKAKPPSSFGEVIKLLGTALELRHARPKIVSRAACQEVIHRFDQNPSADTVGRGSRRAGELTDPTLLDLPILKCWPLDAGRFITLPCVVTRDPDTGERNVGMYRMQVFDAQTTGMHWQLHKVAARHGKRYYETGQRMPVSVFLGGDPVFTFAATAPLPDGFDEFVLAGFLRKKSVELVKCVTNDLEVPAGADIVLEGYVDPKEPLRSEGPFGDHTGYYSTADLYPAFHLTAITRRKDAIYPATIVGIPPMEDFYIGTASVKLFLPVFKMTFPELVDIALPAEGVFHNLVFVSIKKTYPMQAYKIMHGLWGMGQMMFTKYIVVVDEDVNVHNTSEVLFRLCATTDPQRDTVLTKGPADALDHATPEFAIGSKMGIDATRKLPGEGFKREWPPLIKMDEAVKNKINQLVSG